MAKTSWRQYAEKLVDIYVTWKLSADTDAGWHGAGTSGQIVDYLGEIPRSSGYAAVDKMEKEIRYLIGEHADLPLAKSLLARLDKRYYDAVVSDRAFRNRVKVAIDPFDPDKQVEINYTDERIADTLKISVRTYRERITEGYRLIAMDCGYEQAAA